MTPNGLDGADEGGSHHTTAAELAETMRYCIMESPKRAEFLKITGTGSHQFSDLEQKQKYSCTNHNAFLTMMDGAISGKTGFTGEAGYCYVGALKSGKRTLIVSLLACGWPNNRDYKWADTKKLMEYGLEHFAYQSVKWAGQTFRIQVQDGAADLGQNISYTGAKVISEQENLSFLLADWETVQVRRKIPKIVSAPIRAGTRIGEIEYLVDGEILASLPVVIQKTVEKRDFAWCWENIAELYFLKCQTG